MKATASRAIASTDVGVLPSDAPMPWLSKTMTRRLVAMPSTTRGSHLSSSAARWLRKTTGTPVSGPSCRYTNFVPPTPMRLVGAFLHGMLDPGCDCACMLILPSKGIVAYSAPRMTTFPTARRELSCQRRGAVRRRHGRVESKVPSDPGVQRARRCKSAKQSQTGREATGRVSEFRASRPGGFQHNVGHDARRVGRLEGRSQLPAHGRTRLTVFIELRVGFQQVRVEVRLRVRRLDDRDPDPPGAELMVE